jgi:cytoskeletal protein CcmA (bactofilin family)
MRTDLRRLPALVAAAALLSLGAAGLGAQDTLRTTGTPEATRHTADRVSVNGDQTVARDEEVDGRVVVMRGSLRVQGAVHGDVTVAGGNLVVDPGARIDGDAHVAGGRIENRGLIAGDAVVTGGGTLINDGGGRVRGEMRVTDAADARAARAEAIAARTAANRIHMHRGFVPPAMAGFSGLMSTLALGIVLAGLGAALVFYAYPRLEAMSDTLRREPGRAAGLGIAAGFLTVPALVVLVVVLCITFIGIPLLLVAVPGFILAVAAAAGLGLIAAAHALGERTAELHGSLEPHRRNGYTYVFTGLGLLLAPMAAAHLLQMTGFLDFLGDVLEFFAGLLLWIAAAVGAGSVILTRAGGWWNWPRRKAAYDPILDSDPPFDAAAAGGSHA